MKATSELTGQTAVLRSSSGPVLLFMVLAVAAWAAMVLFARWPGYTFFDTADAVMWSRHGYVLNTGVHPPVLPWLLHSIDLIYPLDRFVLMAFAAVNLLAGLFAIWKIARLVVGVDRAMLALVLCGWLPYTTYFALKLNHNAMMISLWPLTVWAFMACLRRPTWLRGAAFGAVAAVGVLTKYYLLVLLAAMVIVSLWPSRRAQFYRSPVPYVAVAVFCVLVAPHVYTTYVGDANAFALLFHDDGLRRPNPLVYALQSQGSVVVPLAWMVFDIATALAPLALGFLLLRRMQDVNAVVARDRDGKSFDLLWQLCVVAFVLTLVVVIVFGLSVRADWMAPIFTLAPVLLAGLLATPSPQLQSRIARLCLLACIAIPLAGPIVLYLHFRAGSESAIAPHAEIARDAAAVWQAATGRPLANVAGDLRLGVTAAMEVQERPRFEGFRVVFTPEDVAREGLLLLCPGNGEHCRAAASARAPHGLTCRLRHSRRMWGTQGREYLTDIYLLAPSGVTLSSAAVERACHSVSQ